MELFDSGAGELAVDAGWKPVPSGFAVSYHCQLLAQGKHLEMELKPVPQEVYQDGKQSDNYRVHTGNATWARRKSQQNQ
jgi:hypothetical protein